jgi:hypothetical protein
MKKGLLVVALMVTVLLSALPAAGQDAVKAEIGQAIDAAYLNAIFNGKDIKAFLDGWDHGAIIPHVIPAIGGRVDAVTGNVTYIGVMEAHAAEANRKPPEKKEFTFLYPVVDVTGNVGMAQVEIMRGEMILRTEYLPVVKTRTGWKIVGVALYRHENGARPQTPAGEADGVKKVVEDTLVRGMMGDGTYEQVRAGFASVCDVSLYVPEMDVMTKLDMAVPFMAKTRGAKPLPIKTSPFTLIGVTGDVAAGKLAVTFDSGPVLTMYVALLKAKAGWVIVQIVTDKQLTSIFAPPPRAPQRQQ